MLQFGIYLNPGVAVAAVKQATPIKGGVDGCTAADIAINPHTGTYARLVFNGNPGLAGCRRASAAREAFVAVAFPARDVRAHNHAPALSRVRACGMPRLNAPRV